MLDGKIDLDNSNLCFSPSFSEKSFLLTDPGKNARLLIDNVGYRTYQIDPHRVKGTLFNFLAVFFKGRIQSVSLTICEDAGLPNYDERELFSAKNKHDNWLLSVIGKKGPYVFSWGTIESVAEKKSWSASIVFRYT